MFWSWLSVWFTNRKLARQAAERREEKEHDAWVKAMREQP